MLVVHFNTFMLGVLPQWCPSGVKLLSAEFGVSTSEAHQLRGPPSFGEMGRLSCGQMFSSGLLYEMHDFLYK